MGMRAVVGGVVVVVYEVAVVAEGMGEAVEEEEDCEVMVTEIMIGRIRWGGGEGVGRDIVEERVDGGGCERRGVGGEDWIGLVAGASSENVEWWEGRDLLSWVEKTSLLKDC